MGGKGSGSWYRWDKRTCIEETKRIDIRYLKKHGILQPGSVVTLTWTSRGERSGAIRIGSSTDHLLLNYRYQKNGDDWQDYEDKVWLDRTPCNYGGERLWFLCPRCGRRVGVLCGYGERFLCRHCYELPYGSQRETYIDRMMRKARKIRDRLGVSGNLSEPVLFKPKGIHQSTFDRLVREERSANNAYAFAVASKFGFVDRI